MNILSVVLFAVLLLFPQSGDTTRLEVVTRLDDGDAHAVILYDRVAKRCWLVVSVSGGASVIQPVPCVDPVVPRGVAPELTPEGDCNE